MEFEYKVIPVATGSDGKQNAAVVCAEQLHHLMTQQMLLGFEFYRMEQVTHTDKPGCLAALLGAKAGTYHFNLAIFRRETQPPTARA
jgi:hypothetical protein